MIICTFATFLAFFCPVLEPLFASDDSHHTSKSKPTFHVTSKIVTGQSPFPCPPTNPASPPFLNTQVEPSISVGRNPINPRFPMVVIGYQEDRYSVGGGANADYMIISLDGGKTFGEPIPAPTVTCFGGPYERDTDPHVVISNSGEIYFGTLPYNIVNNGLNNVAISKYNVRDRKFIFTKYLDLTDGGVPPFIFTDYDGVFIDPQVESGKTVYVTWDIAFYPTGDPLKGQVYIQFSKTTDGGVHWSAPKTIYQLSQNVVDQFGGDAGVGLGGISFLNNPGKPFSKLLNVFGLLVNGDFQPPPFTQQSFPYSTVSIDQGETWSNPIPLNNTNNVILGQIVDPANINVLIRTGGGGTLVDRDRNIIYVFNQEHSLAYDGIPTQIILYVSLDDAASWNRIGPVNTVLSTQAFAPAACLIDEGRFAVSYYDFRNYQGNPAGSLQTDRWLDIYEFNKENNTVTLEKELRLTDKSFNHRNAPQIGFGQVVTPGLFLGDYFGMEFFERKIYHVFGVVPPHQGPNQSHLQFSVIEQLHPIPGNQ